MLYDQWKAVARVEQGVEYWLARDLQTLLGYAQWRNFEQVIAKAKTSCNNAGQDVRDHFADVSKMVEIGSGTQRPVADVALTRYACYLIAQNGDVNFAPSPDCESTVVGPSLPVYRGVRLTRPIGRRTVSGPNGRSIHGPSIHQDARPGQ